MLLEEGYTYDVVVSGSRTEMGDSFSYIESFTLYDKCGNDVTNQFVIITKPGIISITKPQIVITIFSLQKYYDGKALSYAPDDYFISQIPDGYRVEFEMSGSMVNAGMMDIDDIYSLPVVVYDENDNDVTDQFFVKFEGDPLRIDRLSITIQSASETKAYDGTPLTNDEVYVINGQLAEGHVLSAETTGTITVEGVAQNTVNEKTLKIYDADGNDVTENYFIKFEGDFLRIDKRNITIKSASESKAYDGKPLTNDEVSVILGQLIDGHTLTAKVEGSITVEGSVENEIKKQSVVITDELGNDVTDNYKITIINGTLTVLP
jgi:ribosomal protein L24